MAELPTKTTVSSTGDALTPAAQNQPHLDIETNLDTLRTYVENSSLYYFEYDDVASTALTFEYLAGEVKDGGTGVSVPAGNVTLTDNDTNYIEVDDAGNVTTNLIGFTRGSMPLFEVVTAANAISTVTDRRSQMVASPLNVNLGQGNILVGDGNDGAADSNLNVSFIGQTASAGASIVNYTAGAVRDDTGTNPYISPVASGKIWDNAPNASNILWFENFNNLELEGNSSGIFSGFNGVSTVNIDTLCTSFQGSASPGTFTNDFSFSIGGVVATTTVGDAWNHKHTVTSIDITNLEAQDTTTTLTINSNYVSDYMITPPPSITVTPTFAADNVWRDVIYYTVFNFKAEMRAFWSGDELILETRFQSPATGISTAYSYFQANIVYNDSVFTPTVPPFVTLT